VSLTASDLILRDPKVFEPAPPFSPGGCVRGRNRTIVIFLYNTLLRETLTMLETILQLSQEI